MAEPGARQSIVREYVGAIVAAGLVTLFLQQFVIQAFRIPSESMEDTLLVGDFLFVSKFEYGARIPFTSLRLPGLRPVRRGDVVVFDWPPDPHRPFIKRCIGVGGDRIEIRHKELWRNGVKVDEPYVRHIAAGEDSGSDTPRDKDRPPVVPKGELFMMGDNRDNSLDSRFWGTVPMPLVQGRALFTYFSTSGDHWWNAPFHIRYDRMFRPIR